MNCSRRIYRGNAYEICLPLVDSGVTLVRIYTRGDVIIEKEPEITADSMCIQLTADELAGLADGVIRYEAITDTDAYVTNSPYILITPDWYSGRTLDDIIQDAYDSGYTDGYESGYTDGLAACESGDTGDTPTAETRYFTITNTSNRDGVVTLLKEMNNRHSLTFKTSTDGINWTEPITYNSTTTFSIPAGGYLMFDGDEDNVFYNTEYLATYTRDYCFYDETAGMTYKISGDISTLIGGREDIPEGAFFCMCWNWKSLTDVSELNLDYDVMSNSCYASMFQFTSIVTPPVLPATVLANSCYKLMFNGCKSLVSAPELPVTTLAPSCYQQMFFGCQNLVDAPELPAEEMKTDCYEAMFWGCINLVNAPELPAMQLADRCYYRMFYDCTSLVNAPELPATSLAFACYFQMFNNCTSLVNVPELPATQLASNCYQMMFSGCTSLVTAPELPATQLAYQCYRLMFNGCSNLTGVTCYAENLASDVDTNNWLGGVETNGVLTCSFELLDYWQERSDSEGVRVPETWAIRPAAPYNQQYLTLEAIENGYIRLSSMDNNPKGLIHVRKNYGEWEDYDQWTALQFDCVSSDTFEFRAAMDSYWAVNFSSSTAKFNAYGNIWSLVFDDELPENDGFWYSVDFLFSNLFWGSRLVDASNLWLGGRNTFIPPHGFEYTFASCTYLVAAPELPMMNLGEYAYNCMFQDCSNLEVAPELPHNNPPLGAYERMFYRCGNLQYIKCDASNTGMTDDWVREVAGYGIFIQAPGVEWSTGWSGIPSGWERYDYLFESDVKSITAHPEATSVTITIKSVYSWTRTSQPDWARTNKVRGQQGETTVRIDIDSATSPRLGDIVFTDEKGNTIKISVTQAEMPIIWVDDFPDGTSEEWGYAEPYDPEFCQEFYEHDSFDEYLDDYLVDKQDSGCNKYKIYGEMNFEGVDYWIYRMVNPETDEFYKVDEMPVAQGLLPKSTNLEEYRSKSMASDHTAFYPAFAHYLMDDGTEYDNDIIDGGGYVLVDTE